MKRALVFLVLFFPLVLHAVTFDELRAQLQEMLARVAALQSVVQQTQQIAPPTATPAQPASSPLLPCLSLARTLQGGMRGEDVFKFQEFLIANGYLSEGYATGYYGSLTEAAVKKWQAAYGVVSSGSAATTGYGVVGPKTRAAILKSCLPAQAGMSEQTGTPIPPVHTCPVEPSVPTTICAGVWEKAGDAAGCVTGYQCVAPSATEISVPSVPGISVLSPSHGAVVTGGNALTISWRGRNLATSARVTLLLQKAEGESIGELARGLAATGVFVWRVPSQSTECSFGESAFDRIEKLARCDGTTICSVEQGTYVIRAVAGSLSTTSPPFLVAGTGITDLLQTFVGAPVASPPTYSTATPAISYGVNACTHERQVYAEGTTLSVPCAGASCTSSGTGYITGACKAGIWCIPFTSYCAKVLTEINASAYEGGGAAPIGSGYSVSCPQEGWRSYLSCPYGGCTTGWNICRGGNWVLDTEQQVVIVGMQGSCASGEVWCGIGTGFGCVPQAQCVNGSAL